MSVRNAGKTIREAREKAGLTQEQLSDGICSSYSLSRIEQGTAGISPSTFQALMAPAGAPCEIYPVFENWNDYECYFHLKHARFHLDAWQLKDAYAELLAVEQTNWNQNKFYYQEYLLLHGILQFRSGSADHEKLYQLFMEALQISIPQIDPDNFKGTLFSIVEIELLIYLAQAALYLDKKNICLHICNQLGDYLENRQFTFLEKDKLLAELAVVYTKYLITVKSYETAYQLADKNRHQMVLNIKDSSLLELTFLTGLCSYHLGNQKEAFASFKDSFFSAHALRSCYANQIRNYLIHTLHITLTESMLALSDIPCADFGLPLTPDITNFHNGVYNIYQTDVVTIGKLIHKLRTEQKVSLKILCHGLCSISKLSKIEADTLQPDIILAETLLQRLGVSDREFIFWGDPKEAKFHELKYKLMRNRCLPDNDNAELLLALEKLVSPKDTLYFQFYLYMKSRFSNTSAEKITLLEQALQCTLKDFDIQTITKYRLSWMELTVLNNLSYEYRYTPNPYQGILYFRQLMKYYQAIPVDIILQSQTALVTYCSFYRFLYVQKHFQEMLDIYSHLPLEILNYDSILYASFHFYYCQALGECKQYTDIPAQARYVCALKNLTEDHENTQLLSEYLSKDFSIDIVDY